jgi:hypothetical protein
VTTKNSTPTNKTQLYIRNLTEVTTHSKWFVSPVRLFALSGLVLILLFAPLLFILSSRDGTGPNNLPGSPNIFSSHPRPVVGSSAKVPGTTKARAAEVREAYGRMSLSFEANRGQADESVDFMARGAGYTLALSPTKAIFQLQNSDFEMRNVGLMPASASRWIPRVTLTSPE